MIGPTLLRFGNEEQKLEHLPRICRGRDPMVSGLFSEPGSGSDLASLADPGRTRRRSTSSSTGTKVWTSYADQADWIFALVRSDPELRPRSRKGLRFILIDMDDPGVRVSPIQLISGKSPFCETHFTNVRVPVKNVIHEIGAGWTVAKALLGHERTMIADAFGSSRPRSLAKVLEAQFSLGSGRCEHLSANQQGRVGGPAGSRRGRLD